MMNNLFSIPQNLMEIKQEKIIDFKELFFEQIKNNPLLIQRNINSEKLNNNIIEYCFSVFNNKLIDEKKLFGTNISFDFKVTNNDFQMSIDSLDFIADKILKMLNKDLQHNLRNEIKKCAKLNLLKEKNPSLETFFNYWKILEIDTDTEDLSEKFINIINSQRSTA